MHDVMRPSSALKAPPGEDLFEVNAAMDRALHRHYAEEEVGRSRAGHGLGFSYEDPLSRDLGLA